MKPRTLCAALLLGLVPFAAAADAAAKKDLDRMQGVWKVRQAVKLGDPSTAAETEVMQVIVKGDEMRITDGTRDETATFTLDPSRKPAVIDFTPRKEKKTLQGIYALDRDKLSLAFALEGKERPTEFASPKKSFVVLLVLERQKK